MSSDGKKLEIRSLEEQHNHVVNPELFRNLPHNRKLDNEQKENVLQMLEMKANKKIIQSHVMKSTGRILLMKDIHNIKQSGEKKSNDMSTLQSAVNELNKCNGAFVKLQTDGSADNTLTGLFFQDSRMRQVFSEYPEFLCIDATYKVNDLRMPLYLLIIENGNGQSEICGIWVVANECEETIQSMVNIFKEQNPKWTDTKTIMTDKDFVEREVFSGSFPDAKLRICLFHVLRTFRREVTTEKMSVNKKQRDALLETLQKTAYSRSLEEYECHKQTLANLNVTAFDSYFQNSWDPIKEQWVIGLTESTSLGNNTNNRVESMNQKIKQVIDKNAKFDAFASDLVHFLHMHRTEINGKICKTVNKVSTAAKERNSDDFNYHRQLTDYGYNLVSSQLQKHADIEIIETWNGSTCISNGREYVITESTCTCDFYHQYKLPCKHIFALRKKKELSLFEDSLVSERWTKSKYLGLLNQTATDAHIETFSSQPTRRAVSQQERFRQAFRVSQKLASVAAENTGIRFEVRLNQLKELLSAWENSQDVVITRVANEEDQQASGSATPAQEITYTETTIEHEHQDDTDATENDQIFDQDQIAPVDNSGPHALETQAIITATISNENKSIDEDDNNSEPDDESVNSEQLTPQIRLSGFADTWTGAHAQIERDLATSDSRSTLIPHSTVTVITQIHSTNSKADDESDDDGVQITQPQQPSKPVGTRPMKRLSLTQRRSECAPLVDRQEKPTSATAVPTSVVHEQNDLPSVVPDKQRKRLSLKLRRSIGGLPEVQQKCILVNATEEDNEMHENERLVPVAVHNDEEIAAEQLLQLAAGSTIDPANGDFSETEIEPSTSGESTSTISTSNVISGISLPPKIPKRGHP